MVFEDVRLNFHEFNAGVNRLANALSALGVKKGDKVATILPNCLPLLETYWAAAKLGVVVVPLSPLLRERALSSLIRDSDVETIIAGADIAAALLALKTDIPHVSDDHIILTSDLASAGFQNYASRHEYQL